MVEEFPFELKLKKEGTSVHQKPTLLPPDQREWVNREMELLIASRVIKRALTAKFTRKVVLVEEG